ncbi:hypothetical protein BD309DRAFT_889459 [Dichomitus squalens]|nr:hypothetical protein BD309DRAFT_889459 [Dichomitus squalens]
MWLLSTDRAELHLHNNPEDVPGGYAILSHVWDTREQTYQDIRQLQENCASDRTNPRDFVGEKIKQSCLIAERHGYKWIWNDTCCIDKTSSSALSEAINSMYRYYSLADVCYAFLADVPSASSTRPLDEKSAKLFAKSKWHKRGWTLQELIAPSFLIFLSSRWEVLGTKHHLASLLESVTRVPAPLLTNEQELGSFSPAQRISWAADRETTRIEDRAYSLLGIFGIHMTTLYGEGERAFQRLQEKIMKTSIDTSLFTWGPRIEWSSLCAAASAKGRHHDHRNSDLYLLSTSPRKYHLASKVYFATSPTLFGRTPNDPAIETLGGQVIRKPYSSRPTSIPTFSITQYGVHCHFPVITTPSFKVAILFCRDETTQLGLILTPCPDALDPLLPLYHTGWSSSDGTEPVRVVQLGDSLDNLRFFDVPVEIRWEELYIATRPPPIATPIPHRFYARSLFAPFRLSQHVFTTITKSGWGLIRDVTDSHLWVDRQTSDLSFIRRGPEGVCLIFAMGTCSDPSKHLTESHTLSSLRPEHWASFWIIQGESTDDSTRPSHRCPEDHIARWPDMKRLFVEKHAGYYYPFAVSFSRCPVNPDETLVLSAAKAGVRHRLGVSGFSRYGPFAIANV